MAKSFQRRKVSFQVVFDVQYEYCNSFPQSSSNQYINTGTFQYQRCFSQIMLKFALLGSILHGHDVELERAGRNISSLSITETEGTKSSTTPLLSSSSSSFLSQLRNSLSFSLSLNFRRGKSFTHDPNKCNDKQLKKTKKSAAGRP